MTRLGNIFDNMGRREVHTDELEEMTAGTSSGDERESHTEGFSEENVPEEDEEVERHVILGRDQSTGKSVTLTREEFRSVVAEFFGTKTPTIEELKAKKAYLEETANVVESIKQLEGKRKGKSMIAFLKETAIEGKEAWKEIRKKDETTKENEQQAERTTGEPDEEAGEESTPESKEHFADTGEESVSTRETKTDEIFPHAPIPLAEQGEQEPRATRKLIDIHIYDLPEEEEETPSVESTLSETEVSRQPDTEQEQTTQPKRPRRAFLLLSTLTPLFVFTIIAGSLAYLCFLQTVSVTVLPETRQVTTSSTITIVTGTADTTQNQIPGRVLPTITLSQEQTIATTGQTHQEAQVAQGTITFYNAALYPQTIAKGTLLTGADGVQVATDLSVTVPAVSYPTLGEAHVTAHALQTGTRGNIRAGDIYGPCCLANIQAANSAFTGGEEATTYQSVAKQDIDTATANLQTSLTQSVTTVLQTQVQANETLVTPPNCQPTVSSDHQVGDKASLVQVTVSESCTGITYETDAFEHLLERIQTQAAGSDLKTHYQLAGQVHAAIQTETQGSSEGQAILNIQTRGTWAYQFSESEQQHLAARIAGMSTSQAAAYLMRVHGIRRVSFGSGVVLIPCNPQRVQFLFLVQQ